MPSRIASRTPSPISSPDSPSRRITEDDSDPARLRRPRTIMCQCSDSPRHITGPVSSLDFRQLRSIHRASWSLEAAELFPGDKVLLPQRNQDGSAITSEFEDYDLLSKNVIRTEPDTGFSYMLCQVTLIGYPGNGEARQELIIGEPCNQPALAVDSVVQIMFMMNSCKDDEAVRVPERPICAEEYSWKKCSACYNLRDGWAPAGPGEFRDHSPVRTISSVSSESSEGASMESESPESSEGSLLRSESSESPGDLSD